MWVLSRPAVTWVLGHPRPVALAGGLSHVVSTVLLAGQQLLPMSLSLSNLRELMARYEPSLPCRWGGVGLLPGCNSSCSEPPSSCHVFMGSFGHGRDLARDSVMGGSRKCWGHTQTAPTAAEWPPASTSRDLGPGARQQMVGGTTFPLADQEGLLHFRRQTACETPTELLIMAVSPVDGRAVVSVSVLVVSAAEKVTISHAEGCGSTARCGSDVESGWCSGDSTSRPCGQSTSTASLP